MEQARGKVTKRISEKYLEITGEEITLDILRLMPYVQFLAVNQQQLDPRKVSKEERVIFSDWRKKEWVTGGASSEVVPSRFFWNLLSEILYLGYVDLSD